MRGFVSIWNEGLASPRYIHCRMITDYLYATLFLHGKAGYYGWIHCHATAIERTPR